MTYIYLYPCLNNICSFFHHGDILPSNFPFCILHFLLLHNSYLTSLLVYIHTNKISSLNSLKSTFSKCAVKTHYNTFFNAIAKKCQCGREKFIFPHTPLPKKYLYIFQVQLKLLFAILTKKSATKVVHLLQQLIFYMQMYVFIKMHLHLHIVQ